MEGKVSHVALSYNAFLFNVEAKWNGFLCVKLVVSFSLSCCHRNLYRVRDKLSTDGGNKRRERVGGTREVFESFFYSHRNYNNLVKGECR